MRNTVIALFLIIIPAGSSGVTAYYTSTYPPFWTTSSTRATYRSTCSEPLQPQNGFWELDRWQCSFPQKQCRIEHGFQFDIGTHLSVRCFKGFRVNGSGNLICSEDGTWTGDIPVCEEVYCKDLNSASRVANCKNPVLEHVSCNSSRPGTTATLQCRNGYRRDKTLSLFTSTTCNWAGVWVPQPLGCVPVGGSGITPYYTSTYRPPSTSSTSALYGRICSEPLQPQNGFWELDQWQCSFPQKQCRIEHGFQFDIGTHLSVRCFKGFMVNGSGNLICSEDGTWTGDIPVCEEVYCKDLNSASRVADCKNPVLEHVSCNSSRPGTTATLQCRDGYRRDKTLSLFTSTICNWAGVWVPQPLGCVPDIFRTVAIPAVGGSGITPYYTSTYRPPSTSSTSVMYGRTCSAPPQPQNGFWELDLVQCPLSEHCHVGQEYRPGTHLVYSCNSGFKISGSAHVHCGVGGLWSNDIPVCEEVHCKDLNSASIHADCTYPGSDYVTCNSPRTGIVATLKCRYSYHEDRTLPLSTSVTCNDFGQWVPEPLRCVPVCGTVSTPTTLLVVNGTAANIAEFPWHATLYKAVNPNAKKEFLCGASIIQERLLITAAHCVYDVNRKDDPSKYFVATGNVYKDYDSEFHDSTIVVTNIYVSPDYYGIHRSYYADIAIVEVTVPFVFSALRQPICLDYSNNFLLDTKMLGRVAGFGRTALGESSYFLQTIEVPYVSTTECNEAGNAYETLNYVTSDKFCAGYTNGSSVCEGDSGGGLVFRKDSLWYLKGIVSASLRSKEVNGTRQCDSSAYSLYTMVSLHMTWIKCYIFPLETRKQLQMCRNYVR